jgi:hypothetical protein
VNKGNEDVIEAVRQAIADSGSSTVSIADSAGIVRSQLFDFLKGTKGMGDDKFRSLIAILPTLQEHLDRVGCGTLGQIDPAEDILNLTVKEQHALFSRMSAIGVRRRHLQFLATAPDLIKLIDRFAKSEEPAK